MRMYEQFIKCEKCECEIMMKVIARCEDEGSHVIEKGAVYKCPKCGNEKVVGNMMILEG